MQSVQLGGTAVAVRQVVIAGISEQSVLAMPAADYMNLEQLKFFASRLSVLREGLTSQVKVEVGASAAESTADPVDRATAEETQAQALRVHARDALRLAAINKALELIKTGDYGWCEETGDEIGLERLMAQPTATLCYEAQERREKQIKFRN